MENNILPDPVEAGDIEKYLPHRYPFLLIDRVLSMQIEPEKKLIGIKNVTVNEPFFTGHFPGNPVMPGVLMIEAMAQAAGMLAHLAAEIAGKKVSCTTWSRSTTPASARSSSPATNWCWRRFRSASSAEWAGMSARPV